MVDNANQWSILANNELWLMIVSSWLGQPSIVGRLKAGDTSLHRLNGKWRAYLGQVVPPRNADGHKLRCCRW